MLTRDAVVERLSTLTTALVATVRRDIPTEVVLDEDDGMPRPCVVNLDSLATRPRSQLTDRMTRLSPERMRQVCQALALATGC